MLVSITGRDAEGSYTLSTIKVERPKDWSALERAFAEKRAIAGVVTEFVKGGLRVDVGMPAFPARFAQRHQGSGRNGETGRPGDPVPDHQAGYADEDVVVDRRAILEEEEARAREESFANCWKAQCCGHGSQHHRFRRVCRSGRSGRAAACDRYGLASRRRNRPTWSQPGESVEVKVLKINPEGKRISLGLKQLTPDPWTTAAERFHTGDRVQGKVSRLADFGAFVELLPGVDGLIHVSEMSWAKKVKQAQRPAEDRRDGGSRSARRECRASAALRSA